MFYPSYSPSYSFQSYSNNLIRVTGLEGARAYQMQPNSTAALFDANEDLMYIKSTDGAGFPTIRTFRFEELRPEKAPAENYISRQEFEEFKQEVLSYGKQLIQPQPTGNSKKSASNSNGNGQG